jgi:hypothetical protein
VKPRKAAALKLFPTPRLPLGDCVQAVHDPRPMVRDLNRPTVRPTDFLTINKQIEQLGEMPMAASLS